MHLPPRRFKPKRGARTTHAPPLFNLSTKRKTRVKFHTIIQQEGARFRRLGPVIAFEFSRFRFHFRATDEVQFLRGTSANVLRGGFGAALGESAPPGVYARIFEPRPVAGQAGPQAGDPSPSGL